MRSLLPLALLGALLLAACTGGSEESTERGFYAEITVEREPDPDERVAGLDEDPMGHSAIRWWYAEGADEVGRWRWEIDDEGPAIDAGTLTTVFDGEYQWHYDDRLHGYQRTEAPPLPDGIVQSPTAGAPVGPANFADLDTLIEQWQLGSPDRDVTRTGQETLLGRETQVIEIRPARTGSRSSGVSVGGQTTRTEETATSGGVIRLSIDPERMFIMRWETDDGGRGHSSTIEVSRLDYDIPIDRERLSFTPPSGARDVTASNPSQSCSGSVTAGAGLSAPGGFLAPSYLPAGFENGASSSESGRGSCNTVAAQSRVEHANGSFILLRQRLRLAGIPPALHSDDTVRINGRDAYQSEVNGITRLVWSEGDVVAELLSDALTAEELLRIAESAQLRPGNDQR